MILLLILLVTLLVLGILAVIVVGATGAVGIILFGDVIVCALVLIWIVKRLWIKKK